MSTTPEIKEKESLGTANSSGSPLSNDSGFKQALESDADAPTTDGERTRNPFAVTNPDADAIPTGAPEAVGTGTSSPHISENPDKA